MHRLQVVLGHLAGRPESSSALQAAPCSASFPQASASDVVVVHGRRTPIGRAGRGGFKVRPLGRARGAEGGQSGWDPALGGPVSAETPGGDEGVGLTAAAPRPAGHHPRRASVGRVDRGSPGREAKARTWVSLSKTTDSTDFSGMVKGPFYRVRLGPFSTGLVDDWLLGSWLPIFQTPDFYSFTRAWENLEPGAGAVMARIAQFLSGIPETVPLSAVNRQCSSGLQAVANIAGGIRNGSYDIGMACGVESMSLSNRGNPGNISSRLLESDKARDCLIPMGITSENVAERFGISRQKQDAFALASQQKAASAQSRGCFRAEIVPVTTTVLDDKGDRKTITVSQDEGVRPSTTMEGLAKLKPAFKDGGSTTAGNSSQVSDGAAAVLLARRSKAEELGLPILGVLRSYAVVGVPPDIMGIGPACAIPAALQKAGLTVNDIDIFEINEAFASQALYCVEKLGIPAEKVNPLGGAIALGHPLGCTGARQVVTLLNELKRRGRRAYGVVSMCIGTGMGAAAVFEYPGN